MYYNSKHSDDNGGERYWHVVSMNIVAAIGLLLTVLTMEIEGTVGGVLQLIMLSVACCGIWGGKPTLMTWFTSCLEGNLAVAIAVVTTCGNISGIIAPIIMSELRSRSESYISGCLFLMGAEAVASGAVTGLRYMVRKRGAEQAREEGRRRKAAEEKEEYGEDGSVHLHTVDDGGKRGATEEEMKMVEL